MRPNELTVRELLNQVDVTRENPLSTQQLAIVAEALHRNSREATQKIPWHRELDGCIDLVIGLMKHATVREQLERARTRAGIKDGEYPQALIEPRVDDQSATMNSRPGTDLFAGELVAIKRLTKLRSQRDKALETVELLEVRVAFFTQEVEKLTKQIAIGPLTEIELEQTIDAAAMSAHAPDLMKIDVEIDELHRQVYLEEHTDLSQQRLSHELERVRWLKQAMESPLVAAQRKRYEDRHQQRLLRDAYTRKSVSARAHLEALEKQIRAEIGRTPTIRSL